MLFLEFAKYFTEYLLVPITFSANMLIYSTEGCSEKDVLLVPLQTIAEEVLGCLGGATTAS